MRVHYPLHEDGLTEIEFDIRKIRKENNKIDFHISNVVVRGTDESSMIIVKTIMEDTSAGSAIHLLKNLQSKELRQAISYAIMECEDKANNIEVQDERTL